MTTFLASARRSEAAGAALAAERGLPGLLSRCPLAEDSGAGARARERTGSDLRRGPGQARPAAAGVELGTAASAEVGRIE